MAGRPGAANARALVGAAACYAVLSGWFYWDLLRAPFDALPTPIVQTNEELARLHQADGEMVAGTIGMVGRRWASDPARLHDSGQCYPMPDSLTLGEPMFVDGLLGALPMAATGNPILAKNVVSLLAPVLGGVFMCALVLYWTGSVPAGLVAGLLFGFHPNRLADVSHPYVYGNVWSPLALLCLHRLFARRRWRDAAALAVALILQMLESLYPAMALALVGGAYGSVLALHHRRALPALLPKLLAVAGAVGAAGYLAFEPYFGTQGTWEVLQARFAFLHSIAGLQFGGPSFPGIALLALAAIAVIGRLRRGREITFDGTLPLLVGGALVYWMVRWSVAIPLVGQIQSPYLLGLRDLPGMGAVRAVSAIDSGLWFAGSCLAGLGLAGLIAHRGAVVRWTVGGVVFALAAFEIFAFHPSGPAFGTRFLTYDARPSAELLDLLAGLPEGAVLDFPPATFMTPNAHYVLLGGFHGRPTSGCYNSFATPVREAVHALARSLPNPRSAFKLRLLGFRVLLVHGEFMSGEWDQRVTQWADSKDARFAGAQRVGEVDGHIVYSLAPAPPAAGFEALVQPTSLARDTAMFAASGTEPFIVTLRNFTPGFYRHPDPIAPSTVVLTWHDREGAEVAAETFTTLLPLALTPGEKFRLKLVPTRLPPPGVQTATLRLGHANGRVLYRRHVLVLGTAPEA